MTEQTEDERQYAWLQPVIASLVTGALSGLGSFFAFAQPEVKEVERDSLRSDVILCETANENRMLIRGIVETAIQPEPVPTNSPPFFVEYIERRNERRERTRFRIEDATRPIDCNSGVLTNGR